LAIEIKQVKAEIWLHAKLATESVFWTLNRLVPTEVHYMEKNSGMFSSKTLISF